MQLARPYFWRVPLLRTMTKSGFVAISGRLHSMASKASIRYTTAPGIAMSSSSLAPTICSTNRPPFFSVGAQLVAGSRGIYIRGVRTRDKTRHEGEMNMHFRLTATCQQMFVAVAAVAMLVNPASLARADWPNWRGPNGNGSVTGGSYPTSWNVENVSWKFALPGKGSSTPIVLSDRIYVTTPDEGHDAVLALDLQGNQIWRTPLGKESRAKNRLASSCNASPVTDGKGIYVYFRSSRLAALELDGKIRWENDLAATYGQENLFWDQGTSPVVTNEHVILTRMHDGDSWIAGFDKATGELRWQQKRNYDVPTENDNGYTTPVFFKYKGRDAFLVWGADHLTAHSATDGSLLWTCGGFNPRGTGFWPAISSPVIAGDLAIVPVGRDDRPKQGQIHAIRLDGSGDVTATHRVWKRDDIGIFVTSPVEYKGRIYLLRPRGALVCLNPQTGETVWAESLPLARGRASYYASPTIAGGVLYAAREDGVVFAARVEDKFELISENPMNEQIIGTPVADKDRLLLRGEKHLFCIEAKRVASTAK
jgi:outer membrane protein assembly factor BamB